jgi:hypothetical protein
LLVVLGEPSRCGVVGLEPGLPLALAQLLNATVRGWSLPRHGVWPKI